MDVYGIVLIVGFGVGFSWYLFRLLSKYDALVRTSDDMRVRLTAFEDDEAARQNQRMRALAKANASNRIANKVRKLEKAKAHEAARDRTDAALRSSPLRPREEVVAGVIENRRLKSGAGAAATKGG